MARSLRERLQSLQRSNSSASIEQTRPNGDVEEGANFIHQSDLNGEMAGLTENALEKIGFQRRHGMMVDYFIREIRYDVLTLHGHIPFQAIFDADLQGLYTLVGQPFLISDLRFYDTETTGLGTGAGTFAFLHTIGRFEQDEFCLYQYLVDDYSAEESILYAMEQDHFSKATVLVTFNGKSFDWPMLQSRRTMYHMEKQEIAGHIDLLHPARRFWKKTLKSVTLSSVEAHVLGLVRQDDLPGKEAPARYFQYQNEKDPEVIEPVLLHNAMDVSSLVGIVTHIADLLSGDAEAQTAEAYTALARYFTEWNQYDMAERCYKAATDSVDANWSTYWRKSLFLKRIGHIEDARQVWTKMADSFPESVAPLVELAKLAEHKDKNYQDAKKWVDLAMERYKSRFTPADISDARNRVLLPYRVMQRENRDDSLNHVSKEQALSNDRIWTELLHRFNRITQKRNSMDD